MIAIPGQMHHVNLSQFFLFRCCPAHIAGMLRCPRSAPPRICHTAAESGELKICTYIIIYLQYLRKRHQTFKKYLRHLEAKGKGTKSSLERREHMHLRIWKRKGGGQTDKWRPEEKICWNSSCYCLFYFAGSFAGYTLVCYLLL